MAKRSKDDSSDPANKALIDSAPSQSSEIPEAPRKTDPERVQVDFVTPSRSSEVTEEMLSLLPLRNQLRFAIEAVDQVLRIARLDRKTLYAWRDPERTFEKLSLLSKRFRKQPGSLRRTALNRPKTCARHAFRLCMYLISSFEERPESCTGLVVEVLGLAMKANPELKALIANSYIDERDRFLQRINARGGESKLWAQYLESGSRETFNRLFDRYTHFAFVQAAHALATGSLCAPLRTELLYAAKKAFVALLVSIERHAKRFGQSYLLPTADPVIAESFPAKSFSFIQACVLEERFAFSVDTRDRMSECPRVTTELLSDFRDLVRDAFSKLQPGNLTGVLKTRQNERPQGSFYEEGVAQRHATGTSEGTAKGVVPDPASGTLPEVKPALRERVLSTTPNEAIEILTEALEDIPPREIRPILQEYLDHLSRELPRREKTGPPPREFLENVERLFPDEESMESFADAVTTLAARLGPRLEYESIPVRVRTVVIADRLVWRFASNEGTVYQGLGFAPLRVTGV